MKLANSSPDLFDLVKNSNGAISLVAKVAQPLTPLPFSSPSSSSNGSHCLRSSPALSSSNSCTLSAFSKIKAEPSELAASQSCSVASSAMFSVSPKPQSFAGQLPKREHDPESDAEAETLKHELLPDCSNSNSNSNSCSSSSSYSHSVSSAADLSLEASTPAHSPSPSSASPSGLGSPSPAASNMSGSSRRAASQTDMLSELVTSSCISSGGDDCSQATDSPTPPPPLPLQAPAEAPTPRASGGGSSTSSNYDEEDDKSVGSLETQQTHKRLRDLPTPESGIGGSLSNSESSNSIADAM